ncbi:phosphodiesterase [Roseovarius faecimaris]|uniref:Phosphodiesterase n=1 Tax=Roseovarius faecimaris TaxID=2494550 RepID=A0A6I6IQC4_9RHOB|nr:phosphodiesterase [Roseovarius faecimaris]QGX98885.1 phosphodiesterase [Roseovarius faecimaris]
MSAGAVARLIWLSDLHFEAEGLVLGHDPRARLDAAIDHINAHFPHPETELCLITGDLVDTATEANYTELRRRLDRLQVSWVAMTGNHDARALFLKHLPQPRDQQPGFAQYEVALHGSRLICLDSLWEGEDAGLLCPARLGWLEARLKVADARPVIIFLHHPPVDLGLPMLDPDKLRNGADLMALLAQFPQVSHVCCGHVHRPVAARAGGLTVTSLRSVLYQAPAPVPAWDWDSFTPPREAPEMGVITVGDGQITIRSEQFCAYEVGGAA